jgi:hypothetical protein
MWIGAFHIEILDLIFLILSAAVAFAVIVVIRLIIRHGRRKKLVD